MVIITKSEIPDKEPRFIPIKLEGCTERKISLRKTTAPVNRIHIMVASTRC
jgi:hypothetical protein